MLRLLVSVAIFSCGIWLAIGRPADKKPIFKNLNETQKTELNGILFNPNATRASIKAGIAQWVKDQNDATLQETYDKHREVKGEWTKLFIEMHNEHIHKLSHKARDLDSKLMAIWYDESLTIRETCDKINQLISTAPDFVLKELFRAIRNSTITEPYSIPPTRL